MFETSMLGRTRPGAFTLLWAAAWCWTGTAAVAQERAAPTAAAPADIGTVRAAAPAGAPPAPGTAADIAPSRAPLDASQPTSVVGSTFIRENVTPTENYDRIIQFTPSVQNVEPVGGGLQQNYQETIRGFQYTQFNTVFDGIVLPGLPTNFAPQSESYFLAHDIGSVQVDRGPGTASTLGYATFGGTVAINSVSPSNTVRVNPYGTVGSWGTKLYGLQLDSGALASLNGARGTLDVQRVESRGAISGTTTRRLNGFVKLEAPVGDNTVVTFLGNYDRNFVHTPYGATLAEIQRFGPKYGLNNDPTSQSYRGYNYDDYTTDFEYIGVKSSFGDGWGVDNKLYTNGYYQTGRVGRDPNGTTPNLTTSARNQYFSDGQPIRLSNDVPGYSKHNDFRDYGDILRLTKETAWGQLRAGMWIDYINASNWREQVVLSRNSIQYTVGSPTAPAYARLYHTDLRTEQPYVEWALTPIPGLVVTPGLKFTATTRTLDAAINSGTRLPANFERTYSDYQPSVDARYSISKSWTVYAQTARGFLAPPINVLYTSSPANLVPQSTWNYQVGTAYQTDRFTVGADGYYIDFTNRIGSRALAAGDSTFFNSGGATYRGLEFEGTVKIAYGASLYGNYTLNSADLKKGGGPLSVTPRTTGAAGVLYHQQHAFVNNDLVYGSVIGKFVGPQYLQDTPAAYPIRSYSFANLALGYTLPVWNGRKLDFRVNVDNLSNNRSLIGLAGVAGDGTTPLFWTNPGRSAFFSVAASL